MTDRLKAEISLGEVQSFNVECGKPRTQGPSTLFNELPTEVRLLVGTVTITVNRIVTVGEDGTEHYDKIRYVLKEASMMVHARRATIEVIPG